ncbi:DUF2974 domain-containing protein [Streptococcus suis]|nr:DUF2974 domain-containing protein [Streptococcus suis]
MNKEYTEHDRQRIANKEYSYYEKDDEVDIGTDEHPQLIGTVREVISDSTGLNGYVIEEPDGNITLLFQGSKGPGEAGSREDWLDNDFPMAKHIITETPKVTAQLVSASKVLNQVLDDYPQAQVTLYGHSLGSMNAQYALATVSDIDRVAGAYIYNGPNVYPALTDQEKYRVDALKYRIHNYIDQNDMVPIGYSGKDAPGYKAPPGTSDNAVGIVYRIESKSGLNPIAQHMWGGYQWYPDGCLKVKTGSSILESRYASTFDVIALGRYHTSQIKSHLAGGGLTSGESLYLDSEQARIFSRAISQVGEVCHQSVQTLSTATINQAHDLYHSLGQVPSGFVLSPDEVRQAYGMVGIDYHSVVDNSTSMVHQNLDQSEQLKQDLLTLDNQLQTAITQKINEDEALAQEFQSWTNLIR